MFFRLKPATATCLKRNLMLLSRSVKKAKLMCCPSREKISLEVNLRLCRLFSIEQRQCSRTEPNLMNKGEGFRIIQTLNHTLFEWQYTFFFFEEALSCKIKKPLGNIPQLLYIICSRRVVSNVE